MKESNVIKVCFPTREEEKMYTIRSLSKAGVRMLLCHGISNSKNNNKFICDCGKANCASAGKHPISDLFPHGEHSATKDIGFLKNALKQYPNANLAVAVKDFFVIDVDGPKGMMFMKSLKAPPTFRVKTGRGCHYYFRGQLSGKTKKLEQIDIKTNGYVMFATSRHKSGVYYRRII